MTSYPKNRRFILASLGLALGAALSLLVWNSARSPEPIAYSSEIDATQDRVGFVQSTARPSVTSEPTFRQGSRADMQTPSGFNRTTEEVMKRRIEARRLVRAGDYAGALDELHKMMKESFLPGVNKAAFGVASFEIVNLGKVYPPALTLLTDYRDSAIALDKAGESSRVHDYLIATISRQLGDDDTLLAMMEALPEEDSRRQTYALHAFDALVDAKDYAVAGRAKGFEHMLNELTRLIDVPAHKTGASYRASTIVNAATFVEVLVGNDQYPEASVIIDRVLDYGDSAETRELLRARISRAGGDAGRFDRLKSQW